MKNNRKIETKTKNWKTDKNRPRDTKPARNPIRIF
jgi:hypothetical protein